MYNLKTSDRTLLCNTFTCLTLFRLSGYGYKSIPNNMFLPYFASCDGPQMDRFHWEQIILIFFVLTFGLNLAVEVRCIYIRAYAMRIVILLPCPLHHQLLG